MEDFSTFLHLYHNHFYNSNKRQRIQIKKSEYLPFTITTPKNLFNIEIYKKLFLSPLIKIEDELK